MQRFSIEQDQGVFRKNGLTYRVPWPPSVPRGVLLARLKKALDGPVDLSGISSVSQQLASNRFTLPRNVDQLVVDKLVASENASEKLLLIGALSFGTSEIPVLPLFSELELVGAPVEKDFRLILSIIWALFKRGIRVELSQVAGSEKTLGRLLELNKHAEILAMLRIPVERLVGHLESNPGSPVILEHLCKLGHPVGVSSALRLAKGNRDERETASRLSNPDSFWGQGLLQSLLNDPEASIRLSALARLGSHANGADAMSLLTSSLENDSPVVRFHAAKLLHILPESDRLVLAQTRMKEEPDLIVSFLLRATVAG
ncbi:MAG: HEAT repeat domain-containing protein [Myxococcota bacterium]